MLALLFGLLGAPAAVAAPTATSTVTTRGAVPGIELVASATTASSSVALAASSTTASSAIVELTSTDSSSATARLAVDSDEPIGPTAFDPTAFDPTAYDPLEPAATSTGVARLDNGFGPDRPVFGRTDQTLEFDIPTSDHPFVERWIRHFQGRGRRRLLLWLSRSTQVVPTYYEILDEHGLPRDLLFLSMVESGFSSRAYSWAHASGPWQFIPTTGRSYGLKFDLWVDERRNLELSTVAAARYLSRLHDEFGDWYLAWAAYNAGEARVRRAIRRAGTNDFWALIEAGHLPRETRNYVPKIVAAALVSKDPAQYGLTPVPFLEPPTFDVMSVTVATDLETIARACGDDVTVKELVDLNPALYRRITPPGRVQGVHVPRFWVEDCTEGLRAIPAQDRLTYRFHHLRDGETVEQIARRYGTTAQSILTRNKISPAQLSNFEGIVVPIPFVGASEIPVDRSVARWRRSPPFTPDSPPVRVYRVRRGDSLWRIAHRHRVSIRKLRAWNGLGRRRYLRIGERLIIRGRGG